MTTQISAANIQASTLENLGGSPTITQVQVCDSNFTVLDDTAVGLTGGFIRILGTRFASGCQVLIDQTPATSVTFTSATELRVQVPALSAGTYILYVVNTDGSTAIRVNALTASQAPAWVTGSALGGAADAAISIQLSAPPATTYQLANGSTLPAGLSLSSGGLLSGTITGLTTETVYNFTVVAIDAELQDSPRSFAITITVNDPQFPLVATLLSPQLEVVPFNRDASTNNFAVTVFGDTRPNGFGPHTPGYYSNFFDGNGDFLTAASNAAFGFGTGDFTVECWLYPTNAGAALNQFYDNRTSTESRANLGVRTNTITYSVGSTIVLTSAASSIVNNTWQHVALVRNSGTTRIYINGVQSGPSYTDSNDLGASAECVIGTVSDSRGSSQFTFNGHISNLRVVKGTAVYTAAFTPPTTPLTAVTNTSLLTCQSNQLIDNSSNNFAITRNGDVRVSGFDPFALPQELLGRGSTYFDGTSDYLSVAGNTAFAMGTGDFTIEAWIYPTSVNTYWPITGQFASLSTGSGFNLFALNSSRQIELYYDGQTYAGLTAAAATLNTWNHVTVTRQGSTVRGFINGVLGGTFTYAGVFGTSSSNLEIGATTRSGGPLWAVGYISNVRIIKGTALYTTAFTPPTQPLTAVTNTSLLTCQTNQPHNNNQFLDSSTNSFLLTRSGNTTQGSFSPYGGSWSNYFDGSVDNLSYTGTTFGTGAYTIECWFNINNFSSAYALLSTNNANALNIRINNATTIAIDQQNVGQVTFTVPTMSTNTWYHIAVVRNSSNVCTVFLNGTRSSTGQSTISTNYSAASNLIGLIGTNHFPGYISNLRVVTGTALYDPTLSTITPPTQPLQPVAGTALLTCCENRFVDDSPNNFAITRTGDVRVDKFSPFGIVTAPTPITHSVYFDGTTDELSLPSSSAFNFGEGNFTLEMWVNLDVTNIQGQYFFYATGLNPNMFLWNNGLIYLRTAETSGEIVTPTASGIVAGRWHHLACVRSGNTYSIYRDGVLVVSGTSTAVTNGNSQIFFGKNLKGYISNFRFVKGTALYTANFTPPTQPLTAVTNTSLLTCQNPTFVDNSTNRFTVTATADARPSQVNPFGFTPGVRTNYTPQVFGGSMYFDGTGDFLTATNIPSPGTGDFTWEYWVYTTRNNATELLVSTPWGTPGWQMFVENGKIKWQIFSAASAASVANIVPNSWTHIAWTRQSGTMRIFINGVLDNTITGQNNNVGTSNTFYAGARDGVQPLLGYLSNIRIISGQAIYTSSFVPPVAPLQPISGTTLLLNGTGAAVYDSSTINNLETVGDSRVANNLIRYGNTSLSFDGVGDYLTIPNNPAHANYAGDFTVECWFYLNSVTGTQTIVSHRNGTSGSNGFVPFIFWTEGTALKLYASSDNASWNVVNNVTLATVATGQWYHLAYTRSGSSCRVFVNGTVAHSFTSSAVFATANSLQVGMTGPGETNSALNGFVSDFRITNGAARYTANFTAPAVAHQIR